MKAKCAGVMLSLTADEPPMVVGVFEDDGEGMDPRFKAEALWESVKDDWPGWDVAYFMNDEAAELKKQRYLWRVGMTDEGDEMHNRIETHNAEVKSRRKA